MNNCEAKNYIARQPPRTEDWPIWFDGKKINEVPFCEEFLQDHPMLCVHDAFIAEKMCGKAESIFLWELEGLRRLIANNYRKVKRYFHCVTVK